MSSFSKRIYNLCKKKWKKKWKKNIAIYIDTESSDKGWRQPGIEQGMRYTNGGEVSADNWCTSDGNTATYMTAAS